ncbi:hypothetical protein EOA64_00430 [Mesorhizobium sp. M1A.F.Ca.IN.022.02.1.1]|uniref:hypothetical protein n=1 Tax=unclassified Mesorhizobium TaxID=325217 RepID=UPI000FCB6D81|nr:MULTISPECIES: hypothetical protein [unclassified Mesorhizobium]RUV65844.1 hypothetical protein EOA64_00430 [Mesorhizobium sp. M1A.F.Ca.IN.022.02.1.1]RWI33403.1 MAG: hypothetical protein EOR13_17770 [Mesorhizobium sp.]RWK39241.1 MAG: hypothetical protein EOR40_04320 [Mesorhizobium sp.]
MAGLPLIGALFGGATASTGSTLGAIGSVVSGVGTIASGVAEKRAADFEAAQMEQKAKEETAASQRDAMQKRREGAILNSRAQALAAASGAGAGTDAPTIVKLMGQTAGEADYNAQTAMYGGYSRAAGLRDSAKARKASGNASLLGSVIGGFGSMAGGLSKSGVFG